MTGKHTRSTSNQRWYREALEIHVGDLLTRGSPPEQFEVWAISAPRMISTHPGVLVIRSWPIDVSLVRSGQEPEWERAYPFHGISAIRREGACWRDDWQEEYVFSLPAAPRPFAIHPTWSFPPLPSPYAFQPGIDYRAGGRKVWHCPECLRDWNDLRDHRPWEYASCPLCGAAGASVVLMEDPEARQSELVLVINA